MSDMSNSKLRKLDGTLLLVFAEAYRLRKLTTVAQRLGMTQSAVSHALGRLREIFEDELFLRRPFGVEPTQRARDLASRVETRSEEHTSELQSQSNLVCRLLLEKQNTMTYTIPL